MNTSSWRKSILNIHWKDWCWSWNSNTMATWYKELTHLKRPWCWERLKIGGEGDDRGWDGWMASPTPWTWVWVGSGNWLWTGKPGVLWFMGSQRVRHDWATELNWSEYLEKWKSVLVTQSCPTLCNPMDYSSPDSFVRGILQATILKWVAIPFFRGSFQSRNQTQISCIAGRFFTIWATREAPLTGKESGVTEKGRHLPSKPKELYRTSASLTPECLFSTSFLDLPPC